MGSGDSDGASIRSENKSGARVGRIVARDDNRHVWYDHTGSIGQPGTGKSYRTAAIASGRVRVIAFDSEHQFGNGRRQNPLPGFVIVHEPGELKDYLRPRLGAGFQVIYQPRFEPELHLEYVMQLACEVEDLTLVVEEAANYCKPQWLPKYFDYIVRCGRHVGISLLWNSQRPADVARKLTAGSQRLMLFRVQESVDLKWASERGIPDSQIQQLASLPDRFYFEKTRGGVWSLHDGEGKVVA